MRTASVVLGLVAGLSLGACKSDKSPTAPTVTDPLFQAPANPVNVTVTTDAARAVTQTVTSAGGTLTTTGADGSQFTLTIPARALTDSVVVTMTPITSMAGLPSGSLAAGVQLAPDGLVLEKDATLTIVPGQPVALANQTPLGYQGSGTDLHVAMPASSGSDIQIVVQHFSGWGIGDLLAAARAALLNHFAASNEARLEAEIGRYLTEARQVALTGTSDEVPNLAALETALEAFYPLVVKPRVDAASSSCSNAVLALQTLLRYEGNRERLGLGPRPDFDQDLDTVLQAAASNCSFIATGVYGEFAISGTICKLTQAFKLRADRIPGGGGFDQNFVPSSKTDGHMSYSGTVLVEGVPIGVTGAGSYAISGLDTGAPDLVISSSDCVIVPPPVGDICNSNTVPIELKRQDHGC